MQFIIHCVFNDECVCICGGINYGKMLIMRYGYIIFKRAQISHILYINNVQENRP